jgi:hypothetical protein
MAPKAADDLPPSSSDEDESESHEEPLLGKGAKKAPASDAKAAETPLSPRDKMKSKSAKTPLTPRSAQRALEAEAQKAMEDPAAAAEAAKKALAESDPAAAKLMAEAEAAAELIKNDPKAAAAAALEAAKNIKPPTAEELAAAGKGYQEEARKAAEAAQKLWEEMMNDRPPACFPLEDVSDRVEKYVDAALLAAEGRVAPEQIPQIKGYILLAIKIVSAMSGWVFFIVRWALRIWNALPHNVAIMCFGLALCYFGGTFTTSIAAAEAFRTMGYEKAAADVREMWKEVEPVLKANAEDDEKDDDGDGISDVDQLTPPELLQRKAILIITNVKKPERIQSAIGSIYAALLAVLATLKLEFAATTAMAMGVADMVKKPFIQFAQPKLLQVLPPTTHQWVVPSIDSLIRILAIAMAWKLQVIISAFYSALRGGKLFAEGLFNILVDKAKVGVVLCPGVVGLDFDADESILDDVIGWILAAQGFLFQYNTGFTLPFPFSILLSPLTFLEWYLRFQISSEAMSGGGGDARQLYAVDDYSWCAPADWNATAACKTLSGACWCNIHVDEILGAPSLECHA